MLTPKTKKELTKLRKDEILGLLQGYTLPIKILKPELINLYLSIVTRENASSTPTASVTVSAPTTSVTASVSTPVSTPISCSSRFLLIHTHLNGTYLPDSYIRTQQFNSLTAAFDEMLSQAKFEFLHGIPIDSLFPIETENIQLTKTEHGWIAHDSIKDALNDYTRNIKLVLALDEDNPWDEENYKLTVGDKNAEFISNQILNTNSYDAHKWQIVEII